MARKILKVTDGDEYDFLLFGIVSQHREYRLCHFLNQKLGISLVRDPDYEIMKPQNRQTLAFAQYRFAPEDQARYFFFSNKTTVGFLVPELKNIDYFLLIKDYHNRIDSDQILAGIKSIPLVLGSYSLEPVGLRARENLVF